MKKTILQFYQSDFFKMLVCLLLTGMLCIQYVTAMPSISAKDTFFSIETPPNKLRAFSYIMQNSLVMKVQFENPAQEKVSIQIFNSSNALVYQEHLGKRGVFVGKYNLQELPNGSYTFVIKSASYTYSKSFSLQTYFKREVNLQENDFNKIREEAI